MLPIKFIYKVFVITLILGLFFCTLLAEDNVATSFQFKVVSAYNKLLKKYGKNNIFIKIGITCAKTVNFSGLDWFLKFNNIKKQEIKNIKFRGKGWPGTFSAKVKDDFFEKKYFNW